MIKAALGSIQEAINAASKKVLGQKLIKQFDNPAPKNKYACFFTAWLMYFRHRFGMKMDFMEYRSACLKIGAIDEGFSLLSHDKMAAAAGYPNLRIKSTNEGIKEKVIELLIKEQPVPFSLNGHHYESIDGYEYDSKTGELLFHVDDPGWQGDTHCDSETLEVFRFVAGKRKYSVHDNGKKRKITRVYWTENNGT